ncbi:hypothetical protein OSTOST_16439, partial [Ostertagia ostertagi]
MRREILTKRFNISCECEGCLDEERNDRMEGWRCLECEDGWLPPHTFPILDGALYKFNVLRLANLEVFYASAFKEM